VDLKAQNMIWQLTLFYSSVYIYEHNLNPRRQIMRINKLFKAYEKLGKDGTK